MVPTDYNRVGAYFKAMCQVAEEMDRLNMSQVDNPDGYEENSHIYQIASMRRYVNGEIKRTRKALLDIE